MLYFAVLYDSLHSIVLYCPLKVYDARIKEPPSNKLEPSEDETDRACFGLPR